VRAAAGGVGRASLWQVKTKAGVVVEVLRGARGAAHGVYSRSKRGFRSVRPSAYSVSTLRARLLRASQDDRARAYDEYITHPPSRGGAQGRAVEVDVAGILRRQERQFALCSTGWGAQRSHRGSTAESAGGERRRAGFGERSHGIGYKPMLRPPNKPISPRGGAWREQSHFAPEAMAAQRVA
jgi:hypothetical protein